MKIPKYLNKPVQNWTEAYGMRRAIAVLRAEAAVLSKHGFKLQPAALRTVATALQRSIARPIGASEAETLAWAARLENPQGDFKTPAASSRKANQP